MKRFMPQSTTDSDLMLNQKPRVAVIGAGLAGLSAAWLLKQRYDVTLFESHPTPGMGVHTSDYSSNGLHARIDIPLRIFTQGYYPELFALYKYLGVEMENSDHAAVYQSVRSNTEKSPRAFFQYHNFFLFKKKFNIPRFNRLAFNYFRLGLAHKKFFKKINSDIKQHETLNSITFGQYIEGNSFNKEYINKILLPALAATCTCDYQGVLDYPCYLILEYLTCGIIGQGIVRAKLGVDDIVPKLTTGYTVRCCESVEKIEQTTSTNKDTSSKETVKVISKNTQTNALSDNTFELVIIATQAHIAKALLASSNDTHRTALLGKIPIQSSTMVLHTDSEQINHIQKAPSVSYIIDEKQSRPSISVDLTKAFPSYKKHNSIYQTWNPYSTPKTDLIISQAHFTRPLVTLTSQIAVQELITLNEDSPIKLTGSYMANKIPLLDAAVASSFIIAKSLGCTLPWENNTTPQSKYP